MRRSGHREGVRRSPGTAPVDELPRLRGQVDGLAPQIAQGPREGAEAIHQGRALVNQHEVRSPHDAEPAAHCRGRLEGLRAHLDTEALRGLDQLVEELLGVHGDDGTRRTRRGERRTLAHLGSGGGLTWSLARARPSPTTPGRTRCRACPGLQQELRVAKCLQPRERAGRRLASIGRVPPDGSRTP